MTGTTTIEWTAQPGYVGAVWNPTTGCTRVSAGCDNCYAFALHDKRHLQNRETVRKVLGLPGTPARMDMQIAREKSVKLPWPKQYDRPFSRVQLLPDRLDVPLRTRKPTCYFVDSMADLFHEDVPDEFITKVWATMAAAHSHRFLILTKRPDRMRAYLERRYHNIGNPPAENVWLGTSIEDQRSADDRIPHLLATPAAVRFLSCEPLLGPVDLTRPRRTDWCICQLHDPYVHKHYQEEPHSCARCGHLQCRAFRPQTATLIEGIDWVIVGGESGPRARPMDLAWARSLVAQCRAAGVAPFVKQLGSNPRGDQFDFEHFAGRVRPDEAPGLREPHGRDMDEWPEDLRVREFPR